MKTPISGRTACLKRCRLIAQKNNKNDNPSHSYRPLTLLSSCFCTGPGSMVYQTVTFVPLSLLFWANSRSPLQKEINTLFYNTAARLRKRTLIAGRTACLKRCRHIDQKNNKKCMILNRITDQEYRLPALHFLPGAEAPASLPAQQPHFCGWPSAQINPFRFS